MRPSYDRPTSGAPLSCCLVETSEANRRLDLRGAAQEGDWLLIVIARLPHIALVMIETREGRTGEAKQTLLDAVHDALVEAFEIPDADLGFDLDV